MFYTKYRPQKFSELLGLSNVSKSILTQISEGDTPQALFFYGPRGTGKTTTARLVAKALNCLKPGKNSEPCGSCANCKDIADGRFLDLIEIDAASNRGIDDIRDLREKIKLAPSSGKFKVYIIDEVHMLTTEAFNALLKTLEEPPKHAAFILATTDPQKVPATIKSRCQKFEFKRATTSDLVAKLSTIAKEEGKKISEENLELIAQSAAGGFRDAETLLESVISGGVSPKEALGMASDSRIAEFVASLVTSNTKAAITIVNEVYESGAELSAWTRELLEYLRKMMLTAAGVGTDFEDQVKLLGPKPEATIAKYLDSFMKAHEHLKQAVIPQLPLEVAVLEVIGSDKGVVVDKCNVKVIKTVTKAEAPAKLDVVLTLPQVKTKWDAFLEAVKPYNHSLEAVLRSCFVQEVEEGNVIVIGVPFKFHQEKLQEATNFSIVAKVLSEVLGTRVTYKCIIAKKVLTDADKLKESSKKATATFNGDVNL
ncbi:MAG: DNA polymerase III subunit gamma/tau [candidate division WWE3 bacterium]|nr:DNA polymerase III subunit gamma/tau [candidate division WWE3 bacterium]